MKSWLGRLGLAGLVFLVAASVSLACGQDAGEPAAAETETPQADTIAPTVAVAPTAAAVSPPTAQAVLATTPPEPTSVPTESPSPTAREESASQRDGESSLVLLSSRSVAVPLRSGAGWASTGGFSLSPGPQTMAAEGSLTVSAIGSVTVAADEAYVVVIAERDFGPSGPEQLSAEDRQEIRDNLVAIGLAEDAVEFGHLGRYEPTSISVEVAVDEFATLGETIVEEVEEVVRRSESFGVRFSLSEENCDQAVSLARREAAPGAEKAADDLADALGLRRGEVIGALEYPLQNIPFRLSGVEPDPCAGQSAYPFGTLLPFDSEPEVVVSVGLQVAYSIR